MVYFRVEGDYGFYLVFIASWMLDIFIYIMWQPSQFVCCLLVCPCNAFVEGF